jgi:serine O-acetyltransferase
MDPLSVFLLLLQVQAIHVSSFTTQNQQRQFGIFKGLCEDQRHLSSISQRVSRTISTRTLEQKSRYSSFRAASISGENAEDGGENENESSRRTPTYDLGVGKNPPVGSSAKTNNDESDKDDIHWNVPDDPNGKVVSESLTKSIAETYSANKTEDDNIQPRRVRRMVARTQESSTLRGAIWHEEHYSVDDTREKETTRPSNFSPFSSSTANANGKFEDSNGQSSPRNQDDQEGPIKRPELFYPNIDLSIPPSVYDPETSTDVVWDLMRWEAYQEAQREPLLVSFLYTSILNHNSLESSLAFLLANKLSSAAMISTQVQSLILDALDKDRSIGRAIRADIMVSKQMIVCR